MKPFINLSRIQQWRKQRAQKRKNKRRLTMREIKTRSYAWKLSDKPKETQGDQNEKGNYQRLGQKKKKGKG